MTQSTTNKKSLPYSVVEAHGLTKTFKDFWGRPKAKAVNGIDFTVKSGTVFGLLGPNGSGKSTTVKMLLGLLYPTRGQLTVLGESPEHVNTKQRIGYLPEESYLYPYLTAAESLDFFGSLFSLASAERSKRTGQLLQMVGLSGARNRAVGEFSKGMARRIGLAQALVNDPELVILDEPTAGLDPIGCREVKDVIRLLAERGKTVILCSHLLSDVEDVCDELIVLYGGRICARGGLRDLLKIEDRTRIIAPRLDGDKLQKVLAVMREIIGNNEIDVDHPAMNLEELFLDVVRRARESSIETAGVEVGGSIAEYLKEETPEKDEDHQKKQALLRQLIAAKDEDLSRSEAERKASEDRDEAEKRKAADSRSEKASDALAQLKSSEDQEAEGEDVERETTPPASRPDEKASKRLRNLLGEDKNHRPGDQ